MIPKIIHYCWFGRGEMPGLVLKCIESWRKYLPDYELKLWNEENFDVQCIPYVKEAYENKKYAFVSDYVRLHALYTEGGIYMDTDMEVLKDFGPILQHNAVFGFESNGYVQSCMIASEKGGTCIKDLMDAYQLRRFVKDDNTFDLTPNTVPISDYMAEKGLKMGNSYQEIEGVATVYPSDYFCPVNQNTGEIHTTENSYCIHHFAGSWMPTKMRFASKLKKALSSLLGPKVINYIIDKVGLRKWKEKEMNK